MKQQRLTKVSKGPDAITSSTLLDQIPPSKEQEGNYQVSLMMHG
jgi:hypothetical protein